LYLRVPSPTIARDKSAAADTGGVKASAADQKASMRFVPRIDRQTTRPLLSSLTEPVAGSMRERCISTPGGSAHAWSTFFWLATAEAVLSDVSEPD
jgi:hypothetical protein